MSRQSIVVTQALVAVMIAGASPAFAQSFVNGTFETGDLTGWTVTPTTNGMTGVQAVQSFDIDGAGPLGMSLAAQFQVGQIASVFNDQEGIELTQMLTLAAGVQYQLSLNWAATRLSAGDNAEGGVFTLFAGATNLATQSAGTTSASMPHFGLLSASYTPTASGAVRVGVRITRPYLIPGDVLEWIDNVTISGGGPVCYANCDGSTTAPVLNISDFTCFLQKFAIGDAYANCDGSTTAPVLNISDFTCFLQKFAQGCP